MTAGAEGRAGASRNKQHKRLEAAVGGTCGVDINVGDGQWEALGAWELIARCIFPPALLNALRSLRVPVGVRRVYTVAWLH